MAASFSFPANISYDTKCVIPPLGLDDPACADDDDDDDDNDAIIIIIIIIVCYMYICQLWCHVLHVVTQYLVSCNFMWMFCEGLYLHTLIARAFTTGNKLLAACYLIGWGTPASHNSLTYLLAQGQHPTHQFRRSKSVTSWRGQKSVVSVVSCRFPNSIITTCRQLAVDLLATS